MPNLCYNQAKFVFPNEELKSVFLLAIKDECLFSTFVPLSDGETNSNIEKWGTKWEPTEFAIIENKILPDFFIDETIETYIEEKKSMEIVFETAWCPPVGFYENINKIHGILVEAFFYESGEEVFGMSVYNNLDHNNKYYNYPRNKKQLDEIREHIGINSDLDEFMYSVWDMLTNKWDECNSDDSF